jgi:ubiquinone/menaquinone biosynthesis C-methylase UbiE
MFKSTDTRIYNKKTNININHVNEFWQNKAQKESGYSTVLLNTNLPENANIIRNQKEKEFLFDCLKNKKYNILEIGCGNGRWVDNLKEKYINRYDGIDFVENFINQCNEKFAKISDIHFYCMSATDLKQDILKKHYDLIIITGVSMYINDKDLELLYRNLNNLLTLNGSLYIQESVSTINQRLTLNDFYSEELNSKYNAIYRTIEEYSCIIERNFTNIKLKNSGYLLTKDIGARKETNAYCYFYERG